MADSHQGDTYNIKNTFYKYESDDRQLLVDLLHEYSEKLIQLSQELELKKQQRGKQARIHKTYKIIEKIFEISFYVSTTILALISLFILIWYSFSRYDIFVSKQLKTLETIDFFVILLLLGIFMIFSLIIFQAPKINSIENRMPPKIIRAINLLEEDARTIADKLEKVMRVTIEIQDQIEINLARKLELDLRIGDAQSALEYYYSTIETR